jgi:hypothetical protein
VKKFGLCQAHGGLLWVRVCGRLPLIT